MNLRRLAGAGAAALCLALPAAASAAKPIPGQYIVVLKHGNDSAAVAAQHRRAAGARVMHTYGHAVDGYAARLSDSGLREVKADPRVAFVTPDVEAHPLAAQTLPTGINRIDADLSPAAQLAGNGSGAVAGDVAVYDTGIQTNHPDLNVAGGVNCLGPVGDRNDGTNGVVGVAPGVRLWSVRVDDSWASTTTSAQLCGIDWITQNGPGLGIKVVNSSQLLAGGLDDGNCGYTAGDVMHQAICASIAAGITWVFAAGNSTADLQKYSGPGYDDVLTVTAMADANGQPNVGSTTKFSCKSVLRTNGNNTYTGTDDTPADFSNWTASASEQAHVVAAPGVCIYSTFIGSTYGNWAGTSMAAPHVAGTVHLCIVSGQCTGTPAQIIQKVRADAAAYTQANPRWGFQGDPSHPIAGRYYGYLVRAGLY
jgi:hypothetical protein